MFKSGFVSIVGRPNVGKSTLLNKILGEKIAIVSSKPQTTRTKITGVYTDKDVQYVFMDTPGIHKAQNKLGEFMNQTVNQAASDVEVILYLIDATQKNIERDLETMQGLALGHAAVFLVINKIDLVQKEEILPLIADYSKLHDFKEIIPISAQHGEGVQNLLSVIKQYFPEGPKYFPEDTLTDQPERVIVAEMIREKLFRLLNEEIPFGTAVEIEKMSYDEERNLTKISGVIQCEKASHKGIIIGKNGTMLKRVGSDARKDIERFLDSKVYLELWVKVEENWRNKNKELRNFGYFNE